MLLLPKLKDNHSVYEHVFESHWLWGIFTSFGHVVSETEPSKTWLALGTGMRRLKVSVETRELEVNCVTSSLEMDRRSFVSDSPEHYVNSLEVYNAKCGQRRKIIELL